MQATPEKPLPRDRDKRGIETNYVKPEEQFLRSQSKNLHLESFPKIKLTADGIVDEEIFSAFALDAPIVNQIRAVYDRESLANVVVGDHDGQPRFAEVNDDLLHVINSNGIDAAERLVEHQQLRLRDKRTGNGQTPFFAAA